MIDIRGIFFPSLLGSGKDKWVAVFVQFECFIIQQNKPERLDPLFNQIRPNPVVMVPTDRIYPERRSQLRQVIETVIHVFAKIYKIAGYSNQVRFLSHDEIDCMFEKIAMTMLSKMKIGKMAEPQTSQIGIEAIDFNAKKGAIQLVNPVHGGHEDPRIFRPHLVRTGGL